MIGKLKEITLNRDRTQNITVTVGADFREEFDRLKDKDIDVTIKKASKKRSMDANAFCWAMCTDIGNAMVPPIPKETVYREAIRDVGDYVQLDIREDAIDQHIKNWQRMGIGWFSEIVDFSHVPGYKVVFSYYGSSVYDVETMSRLIDYLIDEMRNLDLPIPLSKKEAERMMEQWAKR